MPTTTDQPISDRALLRLLQLSSATLPVGGFSFSQGLEYAVDQGWITDEVRLRDWLSVNLAQGMAYLDVPVLLRMMQTDDKHEIASWNDYLIASRETAELRLTELAMGGALARLLQQLEVDNPLSDESDISFVGAFAITAAAWEIPASTACHGYLWAWLENQVAAASKTIPLGQSRAQALLLELAEEIATTVAVASEVTDEQIGASLPNLAMASAWHETQYSRLFRS